MRVERMQEVALVLRIVDAAEQPSGGPDPRVMAGGEACCAEALRIVEPDAELDLAVAEHVRIRRAAGFELRQEMREHAFAILTREARFVQWNSEFLGNASRILEIRRGRAIAVLVLLPVRHEQGLDVVTGVLQQGRRDRRIDAAGKRNDDACHRRQPVAARHASRSSIT